MKALVAAMSKRVTLSKRRRIRPRKANSARDYTSIPAEISTRIIQTTPDKVTLFHGCEQVGNMIITSSTVNGFTQVVELNPLSLNGTRLSNITSVFQKFRFRKAKLIMQSGLSTSSTGMIVAGYCENPDFEVSTDAATRDVFALPGARSQNLWTVLDIPAHFQDKTKWYNVDEDSSEIMQTTQGKFFIVVQQPPSITGSLAIPLRLEYEIECRGTAYKSSPSSKVINVTIPVVMENDATKYPLYLYNFAATTSDAELGPMIRNLIYLIEPPFEYSYMEGGVDPESFSVRAMLYNETSVTGNPNGYRFGSSLTDVEEGKFIIFPDAGSGKEGQVKITFPPCRLVPSQ
jgi:hypothetical protein